MRVYFVSLEKSARIHWSRIGQNWTNIQTMYKLPVNALRVFAAVYETGGVRPAARQLKVAHSSVSRHLAELEKWIGVALFERREESRTLVFTPQGEALGRGGLESLRLLASVVKSIRETPRRNAVAISTTPSVAALWLLPRLSRFQKAYPGIELSVVAEQRIVDPDEQAADISIRMGRGPWPGLRCEPLMDDALYPVMSRILWEKSGKPTNPMALQQLKLLHDRDPNTPWSIWLSAHCPTTIDTRQGPRFGASDLVLRAAAQGLGVALARDRLAANDVASGLLVKPFGDRHVTVPDAYWIVRSSTATERAAVSAAVSFLKSQARSKTLSVDVRK